VQQVQEPKRAVEGKILLVDEDAGDLNIYRSALEGQGFEVFSCTSYDAGVQCLEMESFNFVLVSQGSHAFEGRMVLDRALQFDRRRAVLVVARYVHMPCYLEAMQMGAADYLEKPIPLAALLRLVQIHARNDRARLHGVAA
jgi:DNA-binding NtrC family response regulator